MTITILTNNLTLYSIVFVISLVLLLKIKKEFSQEGLLDYMIYLTTKIILFFIMFSSLLASAVLLVNPLQNIIGFISEVINSILIYAFFNYGLMFFLKFWIFIKDFTEKNDLYNTKLIKDNEVTKK
jgi:hypothetical protein